ncbi:MAG: Hsp70 family protein [Mariprofundaceae bacterium]|nr:Hsp70 family protein [Mariprofundaceae bacterium]
MWKLFHPRNKLGDAIICKQPHQAVAYGAAIVADQRFGKQAGDGGGLVQQVCSYDLGLRIFDKQTGLPSVKVLIKRNSPLPATSTTTFHTTRPDQSRMIIEAVQTKGDEETSLGFFAFGPIAHPRKNYPIEIKISYDKQGIVMIRAHDAETGKQMEQVMEGEGLESMAQLAEQRDWVRQARINE